MKIERFRDSNNQILNRAFKKKDEWLFTHCANGSREVTTRVLNNHVTPVLFKHGVLGIEVVDNT